MPSLKFVQRRNRHSTIRNSVESLDRRVFLCAETHSSVGLMSSDARDLPEPVVQMFNQSGHLTRAQFEALEPEVQKLINPHEVEDGNDIAPIDYDKIFGLPLSVTDPTLRMADHLPDFFPALVGGVSVDQTTQPGRTLLRFSTRVHNQGAGPASLISGRPGVDPIPTGAPITSWVNPDGSQNVLQAVYTRDGTGRFVLSSYRAAGEFTYHQGHGHFHFNGYANYALRHRNPNGTAGDYVLRGDGSGVVGSKTGFCLINTTNVFTMENGQSSNTIPGYSNSSATGYNGQPTMSCGLMQGVRVGMADDYTSSLEGQWIDVTGVPNAQYFIEIGLDGEDAVLESNETNNAKSSAYTLNVNNPSGGILPDAFDQPGTPNNTVATAHDMGVLGVFTQTGLTIHHGQDTDYFKFTASSSGNATITTSSSGTSANLRDVDLYLHNAAGEQIAASTTEDSGTESITHNFVAGATYYVRTKAYNSTVVMNYQVAWNIKPTVSNETGNAVGGELGATPATFVVARNGPATSPLSVQFTLGGTAIRDVDYTLVADNLINPNTISIGDLQSTATISIVPISDALIEATETVTLTINGATTYVIGGAAGQQVSITDTPPQVLSTSFGYQTAPFVLDLAFSLDVSASLGLEDIEVINTGTREVIAVAGVSYGAGNVARFTFDGVLPDGNYRATLSAAGVTHALGAPLPGDAVVDFFAFAGDFNHDRTIDLADFSALAAHFNMAGTFADGDADYNGTVDLADFAILAGKFNTTLAAARSGVATSNPSLHQTKLFAASLKSPSPFGRTSIESSTDRAGLTDAGTSLV